MYADTGEIPVNGHAEPANEGLSDRSRVRKSAENRDIGVGVKQCGSPPEIDAGSMDRIAFGWPPVKTATPYGVAWVT
uniref:hypothetical protein n=1 Tax=Aeromonas salmonicida TaxID=645 RepID=UPI0015E7FD1C|nr:hypothetical protein [Aeromonas salmonicida]